MPRITINHHKCKGCLLCLIFCPKKLIVKSDKLNKQGLNYVEYKEKDSCLGCAMCAVICPDCCIEVFK